MLKYKQIWHGIKPTRWLIKFNLTRSRKIKGNTEGNPNTCSREKA